MDEKRRATIREMQELTKALYLAFGSEGRLAPNKVEEMMPVSIKKTEETSKYLTMVIDGLEGLMKDLAYAAYVEDNFR